MNNTSKSKIMNNIATKYYLIEIRSLVVPIGFIPLSYVESFSLLGLCGPKIIDENVMPNAIRVAKNRTKNIGM